MRLSSHLSKTLAALTLVLQIFIAPSQADASPYFSNNQDVDNIMGAGRVQSSGKIEVVEFFWYGCPSCAAFEGQIQAWADKQPPDEVAFVRLPASWHPQMSLHQRLYFTLAMLNKLELHPAVFTAIHNKHQSLKTAAAIEKWAVTQNIPATVWHKAFNSPQVTAQVAGAQAAFTRFQLDFTPAIVFNGEKAVAFTPDTLTRLDELIKATQEKSKAEPITPTVSP